MADCENILFEEAQTSDNNVLYQLEEKLNAYIQELPVLGFISGKYDQRCEKVPAPSRTSSRHNRSS